VSSFIKQRWNIDEIFLPTFLSNEPGLGKTALMFYLEQIGYRVYRAGQSLSLQLFITTFSGQRPNTIKALQKPKNVYSKSENNLIYTYYSIVESLCDLLVKRYAMRRT
jgi:hypothetical protein